jgi:hypothetical protein
MTPRLRQKENRISGIRQQATHLKFSHGYMTTLLFVIENADFDREIQVSATQNGYRNDGVVPFRIQVVLDEL